MTATMTFHCSGDRHTRAARSRSASVWPSLAVQALRRPRPPAQAASPKSCDDTLLPLRDAKGHKVGPASCVMQDAEITVRGPRPQRVDIGLDGTVDGYLAKTGDYKDYFTNGPDLVFPQTWGPRPVFFGVAKYERAKGAAHDRPLSGRRAAWNGRIFVTVHGRGRSFKEGNLKPWDKTSTRPRRWPIWTLRAPDGGEGLRGREDEIGHRAGRSRRDQHDLEDGTSSIRSPSTTARTTSWTSPTSREGCC